MNVTERRYVCRRIDEIAGELRSTVRRPADLSARQKYDLVSKALVPMRSRKAYLADRYHREMFDFSTQEPDPAKYAKRIGAIEKEAKRLKDQAMLGDATAVLTVLAKFVNFKP